MASDTLAHPTLRRTLRGRPSAKAIQYRNLKYASIPGRWKDSIPNDTIGASTEGIFDATSFGPSCPHKRGAQAWDLTLVGNVQMPLQEGHMAEEETMDEFECLTVNVTVPKMAARERDGGGKGLPVFVWVHGGGLSVGSNSWPQYDLTRFVERSVEIGKPIVALSINYRLGILGFLASQELGIEGNFGYKDQILAFGWIKRHIAGFGGDPNNVTAAGESAAGISLSTLLCADVGREGLFERVVIMSGEATLRKSRNRAWHESMYHDQLKLLGLEGVSTQKRKSRLQKMNVDEMMNKLPLSQHFCASVDGKFLRGDITLGVLSDGTRREHKPDWCKEFVVGDTAHDGTILKARMLDNPNTFSLLQSLCAQHLTRSEITSLLSAYDLPASSPSQQQHSLLMLASELRFYLPTLAVHMGWKSTTPPKNCRRYHFHVSNPVEGLYKGLASHELDVGFLFGNFHDSLDRKSKEVGKQMADQWIRYVNGDGWCEAGKVLVIGETGVVEVEEAEYDANYRNGRGKVLERIGTERLWRLAEGWQGVRSEEFDKNPKASL
ncbi:para-nitrobenzyl esterase [Lentithecium fluviatile CBS 122367]|uniref:Para-nitrobenzyl esterase n=1 Tax=Lentithecium fluviatile CBS 122367 TaxID=1168545 RepID=A0A6G1IY09_9PLEO|nr:para-nitrobenzyl esterase [Lentithecium fluviatile CBS 122367]